MNRWEIGFELNCQRDLKINETSKQRGESMCTKLKKMVIKISDFGVDEQAKQGTHNYDGGVRKSKLLAIVK